MDPIGWTRGPKWIHFQLVKESSKNMIVFGWNLTFICNNFGKCQKTNKTPNQGLATIKLHDQDFWLSYCYSKLFGALWFTQISKLLVILMTSSWERGKKSPEIGFPLSFWNKLFSKIWLTHFFYPYVALTSCMKIRK